MQAKLNQFDDAFRHEIVSCSYHTASRRFGLRHIFDKSTYSLALYPKEISLLDDLFSYLSQVVASLAVSPTSPLKPAHVEVILQILDRWPESQLFPGTLPFASPLLLPLHLF
jgi:phospholipase A-2-activating protein